MEKRRKDDKFKKRQAELAKELEIKRKEKEELME